MIASIKAFFNEFIEPLARQNEDALEKALQVASAALLIEMMRMDKRTTVEEQDAVAATLQAQFGLDAEQLKTLIELAGAQASQAAGYYEFTSLINANYGPEQKIRIVENLWQVAMSDGYLDTHEVHLVRKIADLLYVGHADYIAAKQRARQTVGLPPA